MAGLQHPPLIPLVTVLRPTALPTHPSIMTVVTLPYAYACGLLGRADRAGLEDQVQSYSSVFAKPSPQHVPGKPGSAGWMVPPARQISQLVHITSTRGAT